MKWNRRSRTLPIALLIASTLLGTIGFAQAGATPKGAAFLEEDLRVVLAEQTAVDVRMFADRFNLSERAARKYVDMTVAVGKIQEAAQRENPLTFAGVWREPALGVVTVNLTEGSADVAARLASRFGLAASDVRGVDVGASALTLDSLLNRITVDSAALNEGGYAVSNAYVDLPSNTVMVTSSASVERRQEIETQYGPQVRTEEGPAMQPVAQAPAQVCPNRQSCTPAYAGGVEVIGSDLGVCSSGFQARTANGDFVMWTAGHCWDSMTIPSHSGQVIGLVQRRQFSGSLDGEWVDGSGPAWSLSSNTVYYTDAIKNYRITKRAGRNYPENVGDPVCRAGITTGAKCGIIKTVNSTVIFRGGPTLTNQRQASACALPGDSGGPILYAGAAFGVASGANMVGPTTCASSPLVSWSSLVTSENTLGFTVYTG